MPPAHHFRNLWTVSGFQKSLLTAVVVSPNGLWLTSASKDSNLVFINFNSGEIAGTIDLEGRFNVSSGVWRSDRCLYVGSDKEPAVFQIDYNPGKSPPVAIRHLLDINPAPKATQIRALAYDPLQQIMAVGCGGDAYIYSPFTTNGKETWRLIDHVKTPGDDHRCVITALCFYGKSPDGRRLFVGHAKAGFTVWKSPGTYERTPKATNVSSIASATISPDERFIAIASLDQSIVTYALGLDGPVLHEQREFPFQEQTAFRPIVPIALTSGNIIFKGTASGDVPVLDSMRGPLAPLHLGAGRIIRTLTAHGDCIVVGSSDAKEFNQGSRIECYSTCLTAPRREWALAEDHNCFNVKFSELLPAADVKIENNYLLPFFNLWAMLRRSLSEWGLAIRPYVMHPMALKLAGIIWLLAIIMTVDPPYNATSAVRKETPSTGAFSSGLALRAPQTNSGPASDPNLLFLVVYLGKFVLKRFNMWGWWLLTFVSMGARSSFRGVLHILIGAPRMISALTTGLPAFIAGAICDALREYEVNQVCARKV